MSTWDRSQVEALMSAQDAEIESLRARVAALEASVRYYEGALCFGDTRIMLLHSGSGAMTIDPEKVGDVLRERDALKTELDKRLAIINTAIKILHRMPHLEDCDATLSEFTQPCDCENGAALTILEGST